MEASKLKEVLDRHFKWLHNEAGGVRANLSGANLSGANLSSANLSGANLSGAYLSGANLSDAYLSGADLSSAYLSDAYLYRANLSGANLSGANLSGAYLSGANLSEAYLSGADLSSAYLSGQPAIASFSFGNKHQAYLYGTLLTIGCEKHELTFWLENFADIGKKQGYTDEEINIYGAVIKALAGGAT